MKNSWNRHVEQNIYYEIIECKPTTTTIIKYTLKMEASIHIFIVNYQIQFDFDSIKKKS